jgi:hypothetical protein
MIIMAGAEPIEGHDQLPFAQSRAFIIGIDAYEQVTRLRTAVNDAGQLAADLKTQHHFLVRTLPDASGEQIRTLLQKTLSEEVGKDDRVLFYFAGHGIAADGEEGPAGYIVPVDADPADVKTFIPMEDLHRRLDALPCRHLLLILDCCFSGAFEWSTKYRAIGTLMPKTIYKERFDRFVQDPARQVITSAAYDQKALDVLQGQATGERGIKESGDRRSIHRLRWRCWRDWLALPMPRADKADKKATASLRRQSCIPMSAMRSSRKRSRKAKPGVRRPVSSR